MRAQATWAGVLRGDVPGVWDACERGVRDLRGESLGVGHVLEAVVLAPDQRLGRRGPAAWSTAPGSRRFAARWWSRRRPPVSEMATLACYESARDLPPRTLQTERGDLTDHHRCTDQDADPGELSGLCHTDLDLNRGLALTRPGTRTQPVPRPRSDRTQHVLIADRHGGLDTIAAVGEATYHETKGPSHAPPVLLLRMVAEGATWGRKSGRGFYAH